MNPMSMIGGAASALLPVLGKAAEIGMDVVKDILGAKAPQLGADQQPPAPPKIEF
ncbi:hypothetical protein [Pseudomonas sivasensis]|jgi:hypothetical protein|uniref:hypothetical protein n=1 Tax=Pseudomonas sivasensis TaxID=1880678 RepID=UPI0013D89A96|nr:hypothetical protein [Pseudomonas sivasensis]